MEESRKCASQQLLSKLGDCISTQKESDYKKLLYVVMHKCNSVQFVSRQRGALFVASREFCGGLTACFFLVFRLTVKIFRGFTATSAKIWLGI